MSNGPEYFGLPSEFSDHELAKKPFYSCPNADCATPQFVHPTAWDDLPSGRWEVDLCCPNCEWEGSEIFSQEVVDEFDRQLDHGTEVLVRDLKRLTRANMEEEIDRFAAALAVDAILPEDLTPLPGSSLWNPPHS